jgi:hypothetical protein
MMSLIINLMTKSSSEKHETMRILVNARAGSPSDPADRQNSSKKNIKNHQSGARVKFNPCFRSHRGGNLTDQGMSRGIATRGFARGLWRNGDKRPWCNGDHSSLDFVFRKEMSLCGDLPVTVT